jgi:hypothetical protein
MMSVCAKKAAMATAAALLLATGVVSVSLASPGTARAARMTADTAARPASSAPEVQLLFRVRNLPAGIPLTIAYRSGVLSSRGGIGVAEGPDGFRALTLTGNAVLLLGSGTSPLGASITAFLLVDDTTITGTAVIPAGTTVTVTVAGSGRTVDVTGGSFSIPVGTGVGAVGGRT